MDIRKPKPIHNWREFLVELGTIVIGISIALSAEQVIETVHVRHRVHEVETLMTRELGYDDGPQAYERLAISACLAGQLDRLEAGLVAERDSGVPFHTGTRYQPPEHTWDEDGWRAAASPDVAVGMPVARLGLWAGPYEEIPGMDRANFEEFRDSAALGSSSTLPPHPTALERDAMMELVRRLRGDNLFMARMSNALLRAMENAGVVVTADMGRQIVSLMRSRYGECVTVPALSGRRSGSSSIFGG